MGTSHPSQSVSPEVTIMVPSEFMVAVGYHRAYDMFGSAVHDSVLGLKIFAFGRPVWDATCPPAINTRPSAITSFPVQKIFEGTGAQSTVLVVGFQAIAVFP